MKKSNIKKIDVTTLKINPFNPREDYDVTSMVEEIKHASRVHEPLHVNGDTMVVLRGNRRLSAVLEILKDPACPSDLKSSIEKLDCIIYSELTDREQTEIVYDHGSTKPLTRVEIVKSVWNLAKQMYPERAIITLMYHLLGRFTKQTQKIHQAQAIKPGEEREKFLKTWLHGTVGNFLMPAGAMGPLVREQLILTETEADRPLTEEEKKRVLFPVSRAVIADLNKAKNVDVETAEGWDPEKGGKTFNALIAKLTSEHAAGKKSSGNDRKPTSKEIDATADTMQSSLRLAYKHCAGSITDEQKAALDQVDVELARMEKLKRVAIQNLDRFDLKKTFGGEEARELVRFFVQGSEVQFTEYLQRFLVTAE